MLKKLRVQFVCFVMAIVTAMLCVIFATVYAFTAKNLENESLQRLRNVANRPSVFTSTEQDRGSYILMEQNMLGGWTITGTGYFDITDEDYLQEILTQALSAGGDSGLLQRHAMRYLITQGRWGKTVVFTDVSGELYARGMLLRGSLVIGIISLLVFFGISLLLAHVAVRPVEKAWQAQNRFVADASHELKTPLTVIMTNAELLQEPAYTAEEKARFSGNILTMVRQMRDLVNSLLELARVDNGAVKTVFAPLDLSAALQDVLLPFEPLYFERGLELEAEAEPDLWVKGSSQHLRQTVEVLLDNAMKYSLPGKVSVTLTRSGSHCLLSVSNPGDPIAPEEQKRLFDRFYRADAARSRDGSYGLGLSIAKRVVEEHKGKIWAQSSGGQNRFTVSLPLINRPSP